LGFSGGGSNVLLPHTHDGTVAQDGGPLDFDNVTQADLTAGDVVYSDGTHLQRLAIGTPAQQIKVNAGATAPEYFTPAGASATWDVLYDSGVLGGSGPITTGTFSAPERFIKILFYGASVSSTTVGVTCNNSNGNTEYAYNNFRDFTTIGVAGAEKSMVYFDGVTSNNPMFFEMTGYNGGSTDDKLFNLTTTANLTTGATAPASYQNFCKWYGGAYITRFDMVDANPGTAIDYQAGSRLLVLATG